MLTILSYKMKLNLIFFFLFRYRLCFFFAQFQTGSTSAENRQGKPTQLVEEKDCVPITQQQYFFFNIEQTHRGF